MEILQPSFLILINSFFNAYTIAAILLLLLTLVKKPYRKEGYNLLYVYNAIVPLLSLIIFLYFITELFIDWYGQNPYEWYAFKENGVTLTRFDFLYRWIFSIGYLLVPVLFFVRYLKTSRIFILFYIVLLNYERIIILITSLYRDYLPSSWSLKEEKPFNEILIEWMFCAIIFCGMYWILNKRKKLPYPSLFLK